MVAISLRNRLADHVLVVDRPNVAVVPAHAVNTVVRVQRAVRVLAPEATEVAPVRITAAPDPVPVLIIRGVVHVPGVIRAIEGDTDGVVFEEGTMTGERITSRVFKIREIIQEVVVAIIIATRDIMIVNIEVEGEGHIITMGGVVVDRAVDSRGVVIGTLEIAGMTGVARAIEAGRIVAVRRGNRKTP